MIAHGMGCAQGWMSHSGPVEILWDDIVPIAVMPKPSRRERERMARRPEAIPGGHVVCEDRYKNSPSF
jgi:hypothetical protein